MRFIFIRIEAVTSLRGCRIFSYYEERQRDYGHKNYSLEVINCGRVKMFKQNKRREIEYQINSNKYIQEYFISGVIIKIVCSCMYIIQMSMNTDYKTLAQHRPCHVKAIWFPMHQAVNWEPYCRSMSSTSAKDSNLPTPPPLKFFPSHILKSIFSIPLN